jgi:hypothetical protein
MTLPHASFITNLSFPIIATSIYAQLNYQHHYTPVVEKQLILKHSRVKYFGGFICGRGKKTEH